ncbi:DUF7847 domain-containing protein [Natronorubrum sp. FCH18a]|uniref:DUF7847 domain-containing protein n=1 Tax=Natronorubrum sp. FCH18a TaxID=3447018 RepID=UPI003F512CE0
MSTTLQRKGTIGSIGDGIEWVRRNPILIGVFFLYGTLEFVAEILGPAGFGLSVVGFLVLLYLDGLVHVIGEQEATGATSDIGRASATVLGRYVSLLGIAIVYGLVVFVGFLFLVLPGIYLGVRLSLAFPACVIDDRDAFESLSTSWDVAKGNLLKLFGISVASFLVIAGAGLVTALLTGVGDEFYLTFLGVSAVVTAVVSPVVQFAYARVYLENRPLEKSAGTEDDAWGSTTDDGTRSERDDDRWDDANW